MLMTKLEAYLNDMFKCEVRTLAKYDDDDDAVLYHIGRKTAIQEIKEKVSDLFEEEINDIYAAVEADRIKKEGNENAEY